MRWAALVLLALGSRVEARPASTGAYAEVGIGATTFLPPDRDDAATGPAMQLRVGRDVTSWLSLGVVLAASSHQATVPPPPVDEWFQLYRGGLELRIGGRLDRISLFAEAGAGGAVVSSNVLEKVMTLDPGERSSVLVSAGAGLEYQLENRHYALGLAVDAFLIPQFDALEAADARLYLRYTYGGG